MARSPTAVDYCVGTLDFLPLGKYLLEGIQFMLDGNSRAWGDMNEHHKPSFRINVGCFTFLLTIKTERLSTVARPYGRLQVLPVQHAAQYSQRDH